MKNFSINIYQKKHTSEIWEPLYPECKELQKKYALCSFEAGAEFTVTFVEENNKNQSLVICPQGLMSAFRRSTHRSKMNSTMISERSWFFYKVHNSLYCQWVIEQSGGYAEVLGMQHYSFVGVNYIFDIICTGSCPEIEFRTTNERKI